MMTAIFTTPIDPADLTERQQALVYQLKGNSCAWRVRDGWQTKKNRERFKARTADGLLAQQLAIIAYGKGPARLVLTTRGEETAKTIAEGRKGWRS